VKRLVVVSDFDGTISRKDVGNEICLQIDSEKYKDLQALYRQKKITLRDYQKQMWEGLALTQNRMKSLAVQFSELRPGFLDFLRHCSNRKVSVYIASCGLRDYIEPVLEKEISKELRQCIHEISCHDATYADNRLRRLEFRDSESLSPIWPFDKGRWCRELKKVHGPECLIIGIGNGTSDQNFVGSVDLIFATDALSEYCKSQNVPFVYFDNFFEIKDYLKNKYAT
jgi:2-hydroxy-3-keto-5-methylthiopentenyl-1-phosphate phosphatase